MMANEERKIDDGGCAFPIPAAANPHTGDVLSYAEFGMTLRDYFAGQALAMTAPAYVNLPDSAAILARRCYMVADAMLAARAEGRS